MQLSHATLFTVTSLLLATFGSRVPAAPLGTAFTYQGRLTADGQLADGQYDFLFRLYDAPSGGNVVGPLLATNALPVSNGLFMVELDFGAGVFDGEARWLQIGVQTNGATRFTLLSPRQPLLPAPTAQFAEAAATAQVTSNFVGTLPASALSGKYSNAVSFSHSANSFAGDGAGLTKLDANQLTGGTVPDARLAPNVARTNQVWLLSGNTGTTPGTHFLGTTDNQALEIKVNNLPAIRIVDNGDSVDDGAVPDQAPSIVAGAPGNLIGPNTVGATIGGGGANNWEGLTRTHWVFSDYGTVAGGLRNRISTNSLCATISGGYLNSIATNSAYSTISGGYFNDVFAGSWFSTIGGGVQNQINPNAYYATVPGGYLNTATNLAFAAGRQAKARHTGAFVWADSQASDFSSAASNQFLIRAGGGVGITRTNHGFGSASNLVNLAVGVSTNGRLNGISFREFDNNPFGMSLGYDGSGDSIDNRLVIYDINALPRFSFESGGNLGIGVLDPANPVQHTSGAILTAAGVWQNASDVHRKTDFVPVNPLEVLAKLLALPLSSWRYTNEVAEVRHIGPTAQDFRAAFGFGSDATTIGTVDADGVALAAIQGLNQKLEAENAELRRELAELKRLVQQLIK